MTIIIICRLLVIIDCVLDDENEGSMMIILDRSLTVVAYNQSTMESINGEINSRRESVQV